MNGLSGKEFKQVHLPKRRLIGDLITLKEPTQGRGLIKPAEKGIRTCGGRELNLHHSNEKWGASFKALKPLKLRFGLQGIHCSSTT